MQDRDGSVNLPFPGRRTRAVVRISKSSLLIVLVLFITVAGLPIWNAKASSETSEGTASTTPDEFATQLPRTVGADPVPDLSLPKTVLSSVDSLIGAGGVIQTSPDNITLYNLGVKMRLLGSPLPRDLLLGHDHSILSHRSFWGVEAEIGGRSLPLLPRSSDFTILGTNSSGAFVSRTMQVGAGSYSGIFRIVYKAMSSGSLKWDLEFTPESTGHYNLVYTWWNTTEASELSLQLKQLRVGYRDANYTLSWNDVPLALTVLPAIVGGLFRLSIDVGDVSGGSSVAVDPSLVSSSGVTEATAYSFHRKIFYEPEGGYYWAFYFDGTFTVYRNSRDGSTWSAPTAIPGFPCCGPYPVYLAAVHYAGGRSVVAARGDQCISQNASPWSCSVSLRYSVGTISGSTVSWGAITVAGTEYETCDNGTTLCRMTIGLRYANMGIVSDGRVAFSYNWFVTKDDRACSPYSRSFVVTRPGPSASLMEGVQGCGQYDVTMQGRSIVLPADSEGRIRLVSQVFNGASLELRSRSVYFPISGGVTDVGQAEIIESSVPNTPEFSGVSDLDYGGHVVYRLADGTVKYGYRAVSATGWTTFPDIFQGSASYPTITADHSTKDLYAFAIKGGSIVMKRKPLAQTWSDASPVIPVIGRSNPVHLGSNYVSASATKSNQVLLLWTERASPPHEVRFASIPIQTVWSPYASPGDPWDSNGLAPYGEYFANLGQYVSPSTGMLTIRQTDLSVPGRGLDLEITRVYTEPSSFLSGSPYNYEMYPWAPLGNGWQLNFPWLRNTANPSFIHLWDGQGYRIPTSFWTGTTAVFENHQGEHFRLVRNSTGIFLTTKSGVSYTFDSTNSNRLTRITHPTSSNFISFTYESNQISKITDSIQRDFLFCYTNGLLSRIDQASGTCSNPTGFVRRISFGYSGQTLVSADDPAGRRTAYLYEAVGDGNVRPWLLSRITYPTRWYTNYTYTQARLGTEEFVYAFRVSWQSVHTATDSPVRQFGYSYTRGSGDQIIAATVKAYEGTSAHTLAWAEDAYPAGATEVSEGVAGAGWDATNPWSGSTSIHVPNAAAAHQYFWYGGSTTTLSTGSVLLANVFIPSANTPTSIQLQVRQQSPSDWYRVHWGSTTTPYGTNSKRLGPLPAERDQWIRLEVSVTDLTSNSGSTLQPGAVVDGFAFSLFNGEAWCDYIGRDLLGAQFTDYSFSFAGMTKKVSDANHVLLSGVQQVFGSQGVAKETAIVTGVNPWLWTKTQPDSGWDLDPNWPPSSTWSLAPTVADFYRPYPPWGQIGGWQDTEAKWIWWNADAATSSTDEPVWFRRLFNLKAATTLTIEITVDNSYSLYVDGLLRRTNAVWEDREEISFSLAAGVHVLAVAADNIGPGNPAGLLLSVRDSSGQVLFRSGSTDLGSYTNFYQYDLWGNLIYTRRAINPSADWYHESFNAHYNNGLPPGFYAFQETFSQNDGRSPDNSWSVRAGGWRTEAGQYSGWTASAAREDAFSWTDTPNANVVFQAKVYVDNQVGTGDRVGIFVHHPGTGNHKWALVFGSMNSVRLLEEYVAWRNYVSYTPAYDTWYWFKIKAVGNEVWGKVWRVGDPEPNWMVHDYFSQDLDAKGVGVYAGGYNALFDDATVNAEGFSNSFIVNGAPGPNVHGAPAGRAELVNGTGTTPNETYFSYYSWGGLNQEKRRHDSSTGLLWLTTTIAYDNYGNLKTLTDPQGTASHYSYSSVYNYAYLTHETRIATSTLFSDKFSGTIAPQWTIESGTWALENGELSGDGTSAKIVSTEAFPSDRTFQVRAKTVTAGSNSWYVAFIMGKYVDFTHKAVVILHTTGTLELLLWYGTDTHYYAPTGLSPLDWHTFKMVFAGNNAKVYVDNDLYLDVTDANIGALGESKLQLASWGPSHSHFDDVLVEGVKGELSNLDDFNDGDYSGWTVGSGSWSVETGELSSPSTGEGWVGMGDVTWPITLVEARVRWVSGPLKDFSIDFLWDGGKDHYRMQTWDGYQTLRLYKAHAGSYTELASAALSGIDPVTWHNWRIIVTSGKIRLSIDGVERISYTDPSPYTTGKVRFRTWDSHVHFDDVRVERANSVSTLFSYDTSTGYVLSSRDPMGNTTNYQYDILGRTTRITLPPNGLDFVQYTYNDQANYVETINENGWKTREYYDGLGRLSRTERFGVTSAKLRLYVTDASNMGGDFYKTSNSWSQSTVNWKIAPAAEGPRIATLGAVSKNAWVEIDVTSFVNGDGIFSFRIQSTSSDVAKYTSKEGTAANRPQLVITLTNQAPTRVLTFNPTEDSYVDASSQTGNFGTSTELKVDNSPVQHILMKFSVTGVGSYSNETLTYNWANQATITTDPVGRVLNAQYDALGRVIQVVKPDGNITRQFYDNLNSWTRLTDEDGNNRCSISDRAGRLISVIDQASADCRAGLVTNYYYDEIGNLRVTINSKSQTTTHDYDNLGRLTRTTYADAKSETYTYDNNGNVRKRVDRKGDQTLYAYDSLDRLQTITYCGSPITSESYTYDRNSRLIKVESLNATLTYKYDARNRLTEESYAVNSGGQTVNLGCPGGSTTTVRGTSQTYTVNYYYKGEVLERIRYPDGLNLNYTYDGLGRTVSVFKPGSTPYAKFNYFRDNQVKDITFGNGLVGNYTYNVLGRPESITLRNGGTVLLSLNYQYLRTGTVSSITGQSKSGTGVTLTVDERYTYDLLQRLTNATVRLGGTTTSLWYEYDSLGNRLRQSLDGQITTYTYNSLNNQLSGWSRPGTSASFLYDSNGNLASRTITSGTSTIWGYTWNVPGRLLKVASGATQTSYAYDGLGRLLESVESVGGSTTTRFYAYVGTETLYEKEGSTSTDYIYAGGLRIAKATGLSTIKYYHTDHLGSTRLLTSSTKSIIFSDGYQPFGPDNGTPTGSEAERHKFTGKPYSSSIGLYYYYQRWYDPEIGRFVSEDPLGGELLDPQTLNAYVYVSNRPTVLTDPAGLAYFAVSGRNQACAEPSFQSVEAYFGSWFHNLVRPADCWGPAIGPMGLVGATTQVTGSIITRVGPVATKELIAGAAIVITGLATLFGVMPTPTGPGLGGKSGYTTDLITAGSRGGLTNSGLPGLGSTRSALGGLAGQGGGLTTAMADSMTISFGLRYWVRSLRAVPWIAKTCTYAVLGSVLFTIAHDVHLARAGQALSDAWVNAQITGILCGVGLGALRAAYRA